MHRNNIDERKGLTVALFLAALMVACDGRAGDFVGRNENENVGADIGSGMEEPMLVRAFTGYVREHANAQARILMRLPHGQKVTMVGTASGGAWAHVKVDGLDGFIDLVQLKRAPAESNEASITEQPPRRPSNPQTSLNLRLTGTAPQEHVYGGFFEPPLRAVTGDGGIVYERPDNHSRPLAMLHRGDQVSLIGSIGTWAHVVANRVDGYMSTSQLE
jgi:hypothetical protein